MVENKPVRELLGRVMNFFKTGPDRRWMNVDMKCGRGKVKGFRMLDGAMSSAGIARGCLMIFPYMRGKRDFMLCNPMHVLLEVTEENLLHFYPREQAGEIFSAYKRYNRF